MLTLSIVLAIIFIMLALYADQTTNSKVLKFGSVALAHICIGAFMALLVLG